MPSGSSRLWVVVMDGTETTMEVRMSFADESTVPSLSSWDAFLVTTEFIWRFAHAHGDHLLPLLSNTHIKEDGMPTDPAAWRDWQECVDWIRSGNAPRSRPTSVVRTIGPAGH